MIRNTKLRNAAVALTAGAFLVGCAEGVDSRRNTAIGAGLGAAIGAGLGTLAGGDDRRNALIGAGIGLIAGAAVGDYLDRQERELEEDLQGTGADVTRVNDTLVVTLPDGVTFDVDSASIKGEFQRPLNRVATTLNEFPSSYIDVIGHTDSTGSEAYNQDLSERRARSVRRALVNRGVEPTRIAIEGRGETDPIASNNTAEGRARNRRVEIVIIPATT